MTQATSPARSLQISRGLAPGAAGIKRLAHSGMLAIPAGCAAALALVPDQSYVEGALLLPAWLLAAGLMTGMLAAMVTLGVAEVFRAEHVVLVGVIVVIFPELLQPSYISDLPVETIRRTFLAIGVFGTAFAFGSSLHPGQLPRTLVSLASREYSSRTALRITLTCWFLAMFGYLWASNFSVEAMLSGLLAGRFSAPWSRGQFGDWGAFRDHLAYFGYPLPTFAVLIRLREKSWLHPNVVTAVFCSATYLPFPAQGGGRRVIVLILGAALLLWLSANRHTLKLRHYTAFAGLSILTVVALDAVLEQRNEGFRNLTYQAKDFKGLRVDNNFQTLGDTLRIFPEELNYLNHSFIWYVMVRPIPRVLWDGKPINGGFDLAVYRGYRGLSLSNTIVGELYMSFGWVSITAGGGLLGWMSRKWSQLLDTNLGTTGLALYALGAMCLFIGIRSMQDVVLMSYPILFWWAPDWGLHMRVRRITRPSIHGRR